MPNPKPIGVPVTRRVPTRAGASRAPVLETANALQACIEYAKFAQAERTKREEIRAKRDVAIAAIQAEKAVILRYFELRFAERKEAMVRLFVTLDEGVRSKNDAMLGGALQGIVAIVRENPLADFDAFRQNMKKPGFMLEL